MMIEFSGPDFSELCVVGHTIMLLLHEKSKATFYRILCVSKKIKRKLKVGIEQGDREGTKIVEINIFHIITYSFLGC